MAVKNGTLRISVGNNKMGNIKSVSLPAGKTCRDDCLCGEKCYAKKIERIRKNVRDAYLANLDLLNNDPTTFWRETEAAVMMSRFFRFHVSGDIPNYDYLLRMIGIARRNSHCQILCFTKRYSFVNRYLDEHNDIPGNLHLVFSAWRDMGMNNPYGLPEAHVRYRDGFTTARNDAIQCSGNCTDCAITNSGCWILKYGEQVVFDEH